MKYTLMRDHVHQHKTNPISVSLFNMLGALSDHFYLILELEGFLLKKSLVLLYLMSSKAAKGRL